jgi:hypothetical protein
MNPTTLFDWAIVWIFRLFTIFWTLFVVNQLIRSHKSIPWNKYRGRFAGMVCVIMCQIIIISLLWIQIVFLISLPLWILLIFWILAYLFLFLYIFGFSKVELKDLDDTFKRKLKELQKTREQTEKIKEEIKKSEKKIKELRRKI